MWLTGFDAPCLHTMYADKPMQVIARVNNRAMEVWRAGFDVNR